MRNKTGNIGFYVYDAFYHSTNGTFSFVPEIGDKTNLPFGKPNHFLAVSSRIPLNYNTCHMQLFIEQRSTANYSTPFKFSGKEKDEETSYSYFGARYYMSDVSIWLSVDPLAEERSWLSPYNYCQLNPIILTDPTGMLDDGYTIDGNGNTERVDNTGGNESDVIPK